MCNAVVLIEPYPLAYVPDHFKTEGMCNEADVPDHFRTQKMCNEAVEEAPSWPIFVPDSPKTQEICDDAVWGDAFSL